MGCTRGLWIYDEPFKCKTAQGQEINTYFVDTEGLDDVERGEDSDRRLTAIVVLLSCYLIYNVDKVIDKDSIDKLGLAV